MRITIIAGARPNFMKISPIIKEITRQMKSGSTLSYRLVHTGQHYDRNMSETFFSDLGIPEPDVNLGCGGGSQAEQTAAIMIAFEKELLAHPADLVMVVGDVNSTMACSIVAKKLNTKVAHVEAGIRSFDMTMPEEINRMVTDTLTDYFFTTSEVAGKNLRNTGVSSEKIFFVGNVMIDTLLSNLNRLRKPEIWDRIGLTKSEYLIITLHRPNNVDNPHHLKELIDAILRTSRGIPVIFPVHPRTAIMIEKMKDATEFKERNLVLIEPLSYLEFNFLVMHARGVITDSGGITEETTVMGIPCITLRNTTERPETVSMGTNELIGTEPEALIPVMEKLFSDQWKKGIIPELWDGKSSERIVRLLVNLCEKEDIDSLSRVLS